MVSLSSTLNNLFLHRISSMKFSDNLQVEIVKLFYQEGRNRKGVKHVIKYDTSALRRHVDGF